MLKLVFFSQSIFSKKHQPPTLLPGVRLLYQIWRGKLVLYVRGQRLKHRCHAIVFNVAFHPGSCFDGRWQSGHFLHTPSEAGVLFAIPVRLMDTALKCEMFLQNGVIVGGSCLPASTQTLLAQGLKGRWVLYAHGPDVLIVPGHTEGMQLGPGWVLVSRSGPTQRRG